LKPKLHFPTAILPIALFVVVCLSLFPSPSYSQWLPSWFSNGTFWDWSDYRFTAKYRFFAPRLVSGTFTRNVNGQSQEFDLLAAPSAPNSTQHGYNFDAQPPPIQSGVFQLQVDRLGLRLAVEENYVFQGVIGSVVFGASGAINATTAPTAGTTDDYIRGSKLSLSSTRLGFSLDLLRNPFMRAGIDFDYSISPVTFLDRKYATATVQAGTNTTEQDKYTHHGTPPYYFLKYQDLPITALGGAQSYGSGNPLTIGLHMYAIPGRIREIPITVQAKIDFPMPFMTSVFNVPYPANIFQWEASVGVRPSVWDASAFGLSTFSAGIEAGFKSVNLNASFPEWHYQTPSASVKAQWQGAFFQVGMYY